MVSTLPVTPPSAIQLQQPHQTYLPSIQSLWLDGSGPPAEPLVWHYHHSGSTRKETEGRATPSTQPITSSSPSSVQSFCSSSSSGSSTSDLNADRESQTQHVTYKEQGKERPQLSSLPHPISTSRIFNEQHPAQKSPKTVHKRRWFSAGPPPEARTQWTSPDRFIAQRPQLEETPSFQTSKPPSTLQGREKYFRSRDPTSDPFRSVPVSRAPSYSDNRRLSGRLRTPNHTPSFVHGLNATPINIDPRSSPEQMRHPGWAAFWSVGSLDTMSIGQLRGVPNGTGARLASGTNAPVHTPDFLNIPSNDDQTLAHERRLALAMDIDQASRMLTHGRSRDQNPNGTLVDAFKWQDGTWKRNDAVNTPIRRQTNPTKAEKNMPTVAFRVLDAPNLKDDFYCSVLAYCNTANTLAVALTHKVYLWTEEAGVSFPPLPPTRMTNFVTSLAFSSDAKAKQILAVARHGGNVTLWSLLETRPRFELPHPCPASCIAFRPTTTVRKSHGGRDTACEDLLVSDDNGRIYYYSIDWPDFEPGSVKLLVKLDAHRQNICGLAWAPNGRSFMTGGNDNVALFFKIRDVLRYAQDHNMPNGYRGRATARQGQGELMLTPPISPERLGSQDMLPNVGQFNSIRNPALGLPLTPPESPSRQQFDSRSIRRGRRSLAQSDVALLENHLVNEDLPGISKLQTFAFYHAAAVKAIAFAPWQPNLVATGGGSNDRQIHFFHTASGSALAVINVFAQVTSLV